MSSGPRTIALLGAVVAGVSGAAGQSAPKAGTTTGPEKEWVCTFYAEQALRVAEASPKIAKIYLDGFKACAAREFNTMHAQAAKIRKGIEEIPADIAKINESVDAFLASRPKTLPKADESQKLKK